jgi:uncharacterized membrane protein YdjX (TVP38/TMEM64 family)
MLHAHQAVEAAVEEEGWKMVLLLRLSPVIPFALLNYMLSLTSISFFSYAWTSAVGIIPGARGPSHLLHARCLPDFSICTCSVCTTCLI